MVVKKSKRKSTSKSKKKISKSKVKSSKKKVGSKSTKKSTKKTTKKTTKKKAVKSKKKATKKKKEPLVKKRKWTKIRLLKLIDLPETIDFIERIAGDDGYRILKKLFQHGIKMVDEYTLADEAGLQINYARSLLYKLYDYKLVEFSRERDKKKGWFIYSWVARPDRLKELLIEEKKKEIKKIEESVSHIESTFICENCGKTFTYEQALENMFFCDVCGSHLNAITEEQLKEKIKKRVEEIEKRIKKIEKI